MFLLFVIFKIFYYWFLNPELSQLQVLIHRWPEFVVIIFIALVISHIVRYAKN